MRSSQTSKLGVFGNKFDLEEAVHIAALFLVLHPALKLQQRAVLEKHAGKGAKYNVNKRITQLVLVPRFW